MKCGNNASGKNIAKIITKVKPQLVLCADDIEDLDPLHLLASLRKSKSNANPRFVLLTPSKNAEAAAALIRLERRVGREHRGDQGDPPGIHVHVYSLSKIAAEALAQFAAREYELPTAIIRICSTYGPTGGAPADRLDAIVAGGEVKLHPDKPNHFNPIYEDDYVEFGIRALSLASLPPLVVNWAGSETVTAEEYCDYLGRLV